MHNALKMNRSECAEKPATLVLGVSSVGKSTFIQHSIRNGALAPTAPVIFAHTLVGESAAVPQAAVIHYNMLNPYHNNADNSGRRIESDPAIMRIIDTAPALRAAVLVAKKSTLMRRILVRNHIEHPDSDQYSYPNASVFDFVCRIEPAEIYRRWFSFLEEHGIPYEIISTESDTYQSVATVEAAIELLETSEQSPFSEADTVSALKNFNFNYQRFSKLRGAPMGGDDRTGTLREISPYIEGPSILDIGCGEGFFCFSLEQAGFGPITGTELKKDRFLTANAIKIVTGSRCELRLRDILADTSVEQFDTVLLLNVIHHLRDPISAIRRAASLCRKRLILEFPTLTDQKFSATFKGVLPRNDALPLIGVSSLPGQDQTFLFSPEAIRRICLDHDDLFSGVTILPSPTSPDRRIAICQK
jgi:2-polyprenyl-3-methyl-5-hydroxy-6-metoxy-1,4-benzoquinol methylase